MGEAPSVLEHKGRKHSSGQPNPNRLECKQCELSQDHEGRLPVESEVFLKALDGVEQDDTYDIVEHSFSVND